MLDECTDDLRCWCSTFIVPDDESTYARHPVLHAKPMTDLLHQRVMQLLCALAPPMYILPSPRFRALALTTLDWTRLHGPTPEAALALSSMAAILFISNQLRLAYALSTIGQMLLSRFGAAGRAASFASIFAHLADVQGFHRPMRTTAELMQSESRNALMHGDRVWASYMLLHTAWFTFMREDLDVPTMLSQTQQQLAVAIKYRLPTPQLVLRAWVRFEQSWVSGVELDKSMSDWLLEPGVLPPGVNTAPPLVRAGVLIVEGLTLFLLRRYAMADATFAVLDELANRISSSPLLILITTYQCLTLLRGCPWYTVPAPSAETTGAGALELLLPTIRPAEYDEADAERRFKRADELIERMRRWAPFNPHDLQHRLLIMLAERNRAVVRSTVCCMWPTRSSTWQSALRTSARFHARLQSSLSCTRTFCWI